MMHFAITSIAGSLVGNQLKRYQQSNRTLIKHDIFPIATGITAPLLVARIMNLRLPTSLALGSVALASAGISYVLTQNILHETKPKPHSVPKNSASNIPQNIPEPIKSDVVNSTDNPKTDQNNILNLPNNILQNVTDYLSTHDVCQLEATNKTLKSFLEEYQAKKCNQLKQLNTPINLSEDDVPLYTVDADSLFLHVGQFMAIFPTLHEEEIIDLGRIYDRFRSYQQEINVSDLMHDYDRLCDIVKDPNTKLPTLLAVKENPLFTQIVEPIDKYNLALTGLNNALPIGVYMLQRDDADHLPQKLKDILRKHPSKKVKDAFYEKYYTTPPIPSADQKEILNEKNIFMNEIAEPLAEDYNDLREFGLTHWTQIKLSKTSERLLKSETLDIDVAHKAFTYFKDNLITQRQFLNNSITIVEGNQLGIENIDRREASIRRINAGFSLTRSWLFLKTLSERDENLPRKAEWKEFFHSPEWQEVIRQAQNNP